MGDFEYHHEYDDFDRYCQVMRSTSEKLVSRETRKCDDRIGAADRFAMEVAMPVTWDDLEIRDASEAQFDALPGRQAGKRINPLLVAVLDAVEAGGIKEIRVPDESQSRGLRVALGRGASQRGFKLEW